MQPRTSKNKGFEGTLTHNFKNLFPCGLQDLTLNVMRPASHFEFEISALITFQFSKTQLFLHSLHLYSLQKNILKDLRGKK